jgi:hypothetical protein
VNLCFQPAPAAVRSIALRFSAVRLIALLLGGALLVGCQSIDMGSAQLRVIDASVDGGALDAYQNNSGLAYNLSFGTLTSYVAMAPGAYKLEADKGGTRQALVVAAAHLVAGKQYTEIVGSSQANLQETLLLDQSTPAAAGQIDLRFVNEATHAGAVDIYLVGSGGRLVSTSPIATNLSVGANSGYLVAPAGTYAIDVVPAGTVPTNETATLLRGVQRPFDPGAVRTVVLIDQETPGLRQAAQVVGVSVVIAEDADGQ